jgi:hypothetical protein
LFSFIKHGCRSPYSHFCQTIYSRQKDFNACLGQLFQIHGESIAKSVLMTKLQGFSDSEVEDCLEALSTEGRIMVSDGEIYKI